MLLLSSKVLKLERPSSGMTNPRNNSTLLVSLEIETPDPTPETHTGVAGVDVGVRYLAVTSYHHRGDRTFHSGKAGCSQSQPLCETEKASAKERHSFRYPPPGGD